MVKAAPPRCTAAGCRKPAGNGSLCHAHAKRAYAARNPMRYAYNNLRGNARRRGKVFELTFEQFADFAVKTDYINKRGTGSDSYTIDRIDPTKGYTADNIQVLTNAQNVRKYARIDAHWDGRQMQFFTTITLSTAGAPDPNIPF